MNRQDRQSCREVLGQGHSSSKEIAFFACPGFHLVYHRRRVKQPARLPSYQAVPLSNLAVEAQYVGVMKTEDQVETALAHAAVALFAIPKQPAGSGRILALYP